MKYSDIAEKVNAYLYENHDELINFGVCCEYCSIGYQDMFVFLDIVIWDSDNDEREYIDEEGGEYEPLDKYIIKQINKICSLLGKVNVKDE
ncbi:MAG: hypothetical protein RBR68_07310 [Tenuifilaceae bacterium]|nr:hypothetical protein [Tenuifilaceae bacterium]